MVESATLEETRPMTEAPDRSRVQHPARASEARRSDNARFVRAKGTSNFRFETRGSREAAILTSCFAFLWFGGGLLFWFFRRDVLCEQKDKTRCEPLIGLAGACGSRIARRSADFSSKKRRCCACRDRRVGWIGCLARREQGSWMPPEYRYRQTTTAADRPHQKQTTGTLGKKCRR